MRLYLLLLSFFSFFLFSSSALAGQLTYWRFNPQSNQLVFTTDEGVQPKAQLIPNPTRLVVDLPGTTLGRPSVSEQFGGIIRSMRVGQFNDRITRLVIELAPGYTIDPQKVVFRGSSPRQWSVQLPRPERIELPPPPPPIVQQPPTPSRPVTPPRPTPPPPPRENPPVASTPTVRESEYFRVTNNGLFLRLEEQEPQKIVVKRSRDRRHIDFYLEGIRFPADLAGRTLEVNRYGVSTVEFFQSLTSSPVGRLTLNVTQESPDWRALVSRSGDLVLLPKGGINAVPDNRQSSSGNTRPAIPVPEQAKIESIEITGNGTQLLIQADNPITATYNRNGQKGVYEITIANSQLDRNFRGRQLSGMNPKVVVLQRDQYNLVIQVQPTETINIGELNQLSDRLLALELRPVETQISRTSQRTRPRNDSSRSTIIVVPRPERTESRPPNPPPEETQRPKPQSNPRNTRLVVVVDPGHGGKDPGAIGILQTREKDLVIDISLHLQQFLSQHGIGVLMTRERDLFVSLEGRSQMANRAGADLFVSIHANAISMQRPDVNGLETYYFQSGRGLADAIHRNVRQRITTIRDRRVRRARFYVLRKTRMPSVLVEVGFVTGNEDVYRLRDADYRKRMAEAIGYGILEYIRTSGL